MFWYHGAIDTSSPKLLALNYDQGRRISDFLYQNMLKNNKVSPRLKLYGFQWDNVAKMFELWL